jgi:hypothetical protein
MVSLTFAEIAQYRSQLANLPTALEALDAIEDCEGDLEDVAISLAIQVGQQLDCSDWLDGFAKRFRVAICQEDLKANLWQGNLVEAAQSLIEAQICPPILVTPVLLYVLQLGIERFCEPLNLQITNNK